jgi:hypothetical protein
MIGEPTAGIAHLPSLPQLSIAIAASLVMHGAFGVALHEACRMQGSEVEASFVYLVDSHYVIDCRLNRVFSALQQPFYYLIYSC